MANEVNITITGKDLSGPAFDGAMGHVAELKAAIDDLNASASDVPLDTNPDAAIGHIAEVKAAIDDLNASMSDSMLDANPDAALAHIAEVKAAIDAIKGSDLIGLGVNSGALTSSLISLRSKLQSLGIADIADVDVQPGRLMTQLQLLKRLIQEAGINDLLDLNVNKPQLQSQLSAIGELTETIPLDFKVGEMPKLSDLPGLSDQINVGVSESDLSSLKEADADIIQLSADVVKEAVATGEAKDYFGYLASAIRDTSDAANDADGEFLKMASDIVDANRVLSDARSDFEALGLSIASIKDNNSFGISSSDLASLAAAQNDFRDLGVSIGDARMAMELADGSFMKLGLDAGRANDNLMGMVLGFENAKAAASILDGSLFQAALDAQAFNQATAEMSQDTAILRNTMADLTAELAGGGGGGGGFAGAAAFAFASATKMNGAFIAGMPLWQSAGGLWGGLGGHIQLFGGILTRIGIPAIIATASGLHILIDGLIEVTATLIPALIGIGAFAAGAVDSVMEIYTHMQDLDKANDELGGTIYPLTGAFSKMAAAVQPEVYVLFGEGLQIMGSKAGLFNTIATQTGKVLDDVGARITYAITQSTSFDGILSHAASDLAGWADLFGNLFGIIGNFLQAMPGYAEVLLSFADGFTHIIENVTAVTIPILNFGLALHGAILWGGLLATGLVALSGPIAALGLWLAGLALSAAAYVTSIIAAEGATATFEAIIAPLAAVNPFVWVAVAVGALAGLAFWLNSGTTAEQNFGAALEKMVQNATIGNLASTLATDQAAAVGKLNQATTQLNQTQEYATTINEKTGMSTTSLSNAYVQQQGVVSGYQTVVNQLSTQTDLYNGRVASLAKQFGGTTNAMALMNAAGITAGQITSTNKQTWAEAVIEITGEADAMHALTEGTGRYAAALNALSGPEQYLGDMLKSIQGIAQAQAALITNMTQGETASDAFQEGIATISQNLDAASKSAGGFKDVLGNLKTTADIVGAAIGGTTQADYNLNQSFYATVSDAQSVIGALEDQEATTSQLQTATATMAGQMLSFAGNNTAARATIVAMINDALGPSTVSLQNLNTWVKQNSTSLSGLNNIIAQATINAGTLSNVLATQLNTQFHSALLSVSGADAALTTYTKDIVDNQTQTAAGLSARQQLIQDLINAGDSASQATNYVNGLTGALGRVPRVVNPEINVVGVGSGGVEIVATGIVPGTSGIRIMSFDAGGKIPGIDTGYDSKLILARPGEVVIPVDKVGSMIPALKAAGIKGYSDGGMVGLDSSIAAMVPSASLSMTGSTGSTLGSYAKAIVTAYIAAAEAAAAKAAAAAASSGGTSGPNQSLAQSMAPQWASGSEWTAWDALWNQESGWNQYAENPTSDAYGIPQALPFTKMPQAAWPASAGGSSSPGAQIGWGIGYIGGRYGDPIGAEIHENQYHWYDNGGALPTGVTMAVNNTGSAETVITGADMATQISYLKTTSDSAAVLPAVKAATASTATSSTKTATYAQQLALLEDELNQAIDSQSRTQVIQLQAAISALEAANKKADTANATASATSTSSSDTATSAASIASSSWAIEAAAGTTVGDLDQLVYFAQVIANEIDNLAFSSSTSSTATTTPPVSSTTSNEQTIITDATDLTGDLKAGNIAGAQYWNAKLVALGFNQYTSQINQIVALEALLHHDEEVKNGAGVTSVENQLRALGVYTFDSGGWLPPGLSLAMNKTGVPEMVVPPNAQIGGPVSIELSVAQGGNSSFEAFMLEMIRKFVRVKGGGNCQKAFGRNQNN